jgi:hypothetical protein
LSALAARFCSVDEGGRALSGALLTVVRSSVPFPEVAFVADESGCATLHLPAGEFTVRAHAGDGLTGELSVSSRGEGNARFEIVLR